MTDRDRLAADLHPSVCGPHDHAFIPDGKRACQLAADRLIAAGWTRLDEEGLARALTEVQGGRYESWLRRAPLIAKAYREDTDATD